MELIGGNNETIFINGTVKLSSDKMGGAHKNRTKKMAEKNVKTPRPSYVDTIM